VALPLVRDTTAELVAVVQYCCPWAGGQPRAPYLERRGEKMGGCTSPFFSSRARLTAPAARPGSCASVPGSSHRPALGRPTFVTKFPHAKRCCRRPAQACPAASCGRTTAWERPTIIPSSTARTRRTRSVRPRPCLPCLPARLLSTFSWTLTHCALWALSLSAALLCWIVCPGSANSTYMPVPNAGLDVSLQWDVSNLKRAFGGCGTNEDAVVRVLCSRASA
jgi:hypothetical protein